ncbi:hypothetical protein LMH73_019270 [Vibrio splendidus]|nr:hypothetical protein [Vibrio splendidus]MCC4883014.1 hypothetical protein [Vibrio splendidus]
MSKNTIEFNITSGLGWCVGLAYFFFLMYITKHEPTLQFFGDGMPLFIGATVVAFVIFIFTIGTKVEVVEINKKEKL